MKIENVSSKRRKPVLIYKVRKRTAWKSAQRCWVKRAPQKSKSCGLKKFHKNRWVYWRLCRGLWAKKRRHQRIKWRDSRHCTDAYKLQR